MDATTPPRRRSTAAKTTSTGSAKPVGAVYSALQLPSPLSLTLPIEPTDAEIATSPPPWIVTKALRSSGDNTGGSTVTTMALEAAPCSGTTTSSSRLKPLRTRTDKTISSAPDSGSSVTVIAPSADNDLLMTSPPVVRTLTRDRSVISG